MKKMKIMKKICQILLVLVLGTRVAGADLYTVSNIPISAELATAKEARSAAIQNGETDAFWVLMKKMVAPENLQLVQMPPEEEIVNWVQHVSLANEKTTATKYMANLTVRFYENKIQDFLTAHQIPFLAQELPSAVVVPVWEKDGKLFVLDEQNPLYTYLKSQTASNGTDKIVVPTGDLDEMILVREAIENQDGASLKKLAERYEVDTALILNVSEGDPTVRVRTRYVPTEPVLETEKYLTISEAYTRGLPAQIWKGVLRDRKDLWHKSKMQNFELAMTFWVQIPIVQLNEWRVIREKLEKANIVKNFAVRGFRPGQVWVTWQYKGTSGELNRQLRALGLYLDAGDISGAWVLKRLNRGRSV